VDNINNVAANATALAAAANPTGLTVKDELQVPESALSTGSGQSWMTDDDKWSSDDDDDVNGGYMTGGASAGRVVAPPVAVLGGRATAASASPGLNQQVFLVLQISTCTLVVKISLVSCILNH